MNNKITKKRLKKKKFKNQFSKPQRKQSLRERNMDSAVGFGLL